MDDATLQNLQKLYFSLDQNFDSLITTCTTEDQRQQLRHDYIVARDVFTKARNLVFQEDDPIVELLNKQLAGSQTQIASMLAELQDIVSFLGLVTGAVDLAGHLLARGAPA